MPITVDNEKVVAVGDILIDKHKTLADRFRALFTLRNIGGQTAIDCIAACFGDTSALLKHELAYCLGQMQDTYAIPALVAVLKDVTQEPMVRHEAGIMGWYMLFSVRLDGRYVQSCKHPLFDTRTDFAITSVLFTIGCFAVFPPVHFSSRKFQSCIFHPSSSLVFV